MVTKQMIQEQLDNLTEEQINQVYDMIEKLSHQKKAEDKPSLMSKLQQIQIDAPEDFSVKLAMSFGRDVSEE